MKKLWLELDVSGTMGDTAWGELEQPKGYIDGGVFNPKKVSCSHSLGEPHDEGEWREVWVHVEAPHSNDAIKYYKGKERILAVETED